ncbi:MAG: NAD-dependent succinate-semialdehyde dehydrogenase [Phycisphaerales bacterium]
MQSANLINNQWIRAASGKSLPVVDPATDETIAQVPSVSDTEVRDAIAAAHEALPGWRARSASERAEPIAKLAALMRRDADRLASLMTAEQGKPLAEARGEILYAVSFLDWAAEEGKRLYGQIVPASAPGKRILVLRQPVGVSAIITPWNFPAAMITRKLGPALACGCTTVIKPSEETPLSAIAIGELAIEAGIPAGVVNIVTGDPKTIGGALFDDARVRKVSFTGSTEVGKILIRQAADRVLRMSMELGGHAPFIVFEDADIDLAVRMAAASKFRNGGQTCICPNRFLVHTRIREEFVSKLAKKIEELTVGRGTQEGVQIGPMINDNAIDKIERHIDDARSQGGNIRVGGKRIACAGLADRFYAPTLIDGMTRDMLVANEETFGPVAPVGTFEPEHEAIEWANDTDYGLAAYFFTRDASRLMRIAEALDYGVVGANDAMPSTAQAPFGGMKQSGLGREGGHWVMDEYTETKYLSWGL